MDQQFAKFLDENTSQKEKNEIALKYICKHTKEYLRYLDQGKKKTYRYMITFTLGEPITAQKEKEAKEYIYRQHERNGLHIEEYHVSEETTKKGNKHYHVAVETTKPLKKNRFQYYTKKFGNIDLSRTKGQTIDTILEYISKENLPTKLK